jgi:glycerophosphoryl diester phosphodiesterase
MMIWGHRGHRHHRAPDRYFEAAHENSLQAYHETLAVCAGLECDVVQSRQGTPYLVHDTLFKGMVHYELKAQLDDASRALVGQKFINQMNDDEIDALRLKDGSFIPKLHQLLVIMVDYPRRVLNLELKGPSTGDAAIRTVEKAVRNGFISPDQIVFSSFNFPALRHLRNQVGSRYEISAIFEPTDGELLNRMYPSWPSAEQDAFYIPANETNLRRADIVEVQPDFINLEYNTLTTYKLDLFARHFPKAKIILWTISERHPSEDQGYLQMIESLSTAGRLHAAITDFPQEMQARLLARNVRLENLEWSRPAA